MRPSETYTTLIALLGEAQAHKLIADYGGTTLYIPPVGRLSDEHEMVELLGWNCAKTLSRFYDGYLVYVPMGRYVQLKARNELIYQSYKSGMNKNKIARKYGICKRTVNKVISKKNDKPVREELDKNQMDMFLS